MNQTTTSTAASTTAVTANLVYMGDDKLIAAIQRVLRKAAKWKRECNCAKQRLYKINPPFCESYGCASLDELLAPFKEFKFPKSKRKARLTPRPAKGKR